LKEYKNIACINVLGYGCQIDALKGYLDKIARFIKDNKIRLVILHGAPTCKRSKPGISEAKLMSDYLASKGVSADMILDENSRTTKENILAAKELFQNNKINPKNALFFCDACHNTKVRLISYLILGIWPRTVTYYVTKNSLAKAKQVFLATPLNVLAARIYLLEKRKLWRKKRITQKN